MRHHALRFPLLVPFFFGNQGSEHNVFGTQLRHQIGFIRPTESSFVYEANRAFIFRTLKTEKNLVAGKEARQDGARSTVTHRPEFSLLRSRAASPWPLPARLTGRRPMRCKAEADRARTSCNLGVAL